MRSYLAILLVLGTSAVNFGQEGVPDVECPILSCPSVPAECSENTTFIYRGKTCNRCPTWKTECVASVLMPDPSKMTPCPKLVCPLIYIPPDCRDFNIDMHNSRLCRGCPKLKVECISLWDNSSGVPQNVTSEQTDVVPLCPLPCPKSVIPAECQEYEILEYEGQRCKSCPKWKTRCKSASINTAKSPLSRFPTSEFVTSAINVNTDVKRITPHSVKETTTISNSGPNSWHIPSTTYGSNDAVIFISTMKEIKMPRFLPPCSNIVCSVIMIPEECREYETRQYQGMLCRGCQLWKTNCSSFRTHDVKSLTPCPYIVCPSTDIPDECKEYEVGEQNNQRCRGCPKWKESCSKSQPTGLKILQPDPNFLPTCPNITCLVTTIPAECLDYEIKQNYGEPCKGCPILKLSCKVSVDMPSLIPNFSEMPLCSNIACPLLLISEKCRDFEVRQEDGKPCRGCQTWKKSCKQLQMKESMVSIKSNISNLDMCSNLVCTDNIPPLCREYHVIEFQGRPCRSCPKMKENCTDQLERWSSRVSGPDDSLPDCPRLACTREFIPPICRVYETRQNNGQPCRGCQKWKESCRSSSINKNVRSHFGDERLLHPMRSPTPELNSNTGRPPQDFHGPSGPNMMDCPAIQCPMLQSTPPECREATTIGGQGGVSCPGCPRWRPGCQPLSATFKHIDFTMIVAPRTEKSTLTLVNLNDLPCPDLGCPSVEIPPQCIEQKTFWYHGKKCKQCPMWDQRCIQDLPTNQSNNNNNILDRLISTLMLRALFN